ncbi:hypothetical protein GUITHDRAFT_109893 [Guillardia theta CCMP2712]|uniref:GYF domain-containing protein n=1 Tax=Guillardia theta (strain CCMP2712) TaxID=905079 RepID=L1J7M6_GUITC|nr:hypothetical protein GUITHDRAFT_109893 [Guillardia theta CCMP2712]EKX44109.1 hypothetical protein GUITHDRAFT_109893 [Guillardia theta CCMP2712]|eukprot:XP_005831089.1 hypothetical protein GUITHDRAFT_109893 [Guillardia theta CCMP2712]
MAERCFRFDDMDDGDDAPKQRRRAGAMQSSMKMGRELKEVENAAEDWEHSEDSEEEAERRKYEEESGIRIEPFNTDMEREEGHFDAASGHYVEDKFKMSQRDAWLDEVNDKYAHGLQKPVARNKEEENEDDEMEEEVDQQSLLKILYEALKEGETVVAFLRRMRADKENLESEVFNKVTEASDKLLAAGYLNVYSDPREKIAQRIQFEQPAETEEVPDDGRTWEYKILSEDQHSALAQLDPKKMSIKDLRAYLDSQGVSYKGIVEKEDLEAKASQVLDKAKKMLDMVYGPFTTSQMRSWIKSGYFSGEQVAMIRQVTDPPSDFVRTDRVDLDDLIAS